MSRNLSSNIVVSGLTDDNWISWGLQSSSVDNSFEKNGGNYVFQKEEFDEFNKDHKGVPVSGITHVMTTPIIIISKYFTKFPFKGNWEL